MKRILPLLAMLALLPALGATVLHAEPARINPDDLDADRWQPDFRFAYKKVDGLELPMAVFLPRDRKALTEKRPAVVCIHGGAWSGWKGGDCQNWDGGVFAPHARLFSSLGAVSVTISYRNVARPEKEKAAFEKGPSLFDLLADCRSALRYLRLNADRFGIDPNRIAVIGDSAGGHLAACLGTINRFDEPGEDPTVSAMANLVIACNPITDLTDPKWLAFVPETPRSWEGDKPLSRDERARAISPLWNVTASSIPTLAMHGLADTIVAPTHSIEFQKKMEAAQVRCELFTLPNASHAFILFGYKSTGAELLATLTAVDHFLISAGYLSGDAIFVGPTARGCVARIDGDKVGEGRIPGTGEAALLLPDPQKPGGATVEAAEDARHGRVLKIGKGHAGLTLTGVPGLGMASSVSLWISPETPSGTLIRRSAGFGNKMGFTLTLGSKGALTLTAAGVTLTAGAPTLKTWSHIAAAVGPDRAALYLNGQLVGEKPLAGAILIGSRLTVAEDYSGLISDLRVYDAPLTAEAVAKLSAGKE